MLAKKINYADFDGKEVSRVFYFNLTKAELAELNLGVDGGFEQLSESFRSRPDAGQAIDIFKSIIHKAVCEKTPDGKRVVKSKEISDSFVASDAYSQLFIEMLYASSSDPIIDFLSKVIVGLPSDGVSTDKIKAQVEEESKDLQSAIEVFNPDGSEAK